MGEGGGVGGTCAWLATLGAVLVVLQTLGAVLDGVVEGFLFVSFPAPLVLRGLWLAGVLGSHRGFPKTL